MVSAYELAMQRRQTIAYIGADAHDVILVRSGRIDNGAGGFRRTPAEPLPPQRLRLVNGQVAMLRHRIVDGSELRADYLLICPWDADVRAEDEFVIADSLYRVTYVYPDPTYELLAEVAYVGPAA